MPAHAETASPNAIARSIRLTPAPPPSCASRAASAAASSRCTCSSVSIASSFISGRTSCTENRAHANSAVRRPAARGEISISSSTRARYSSGASASLRGSPVAASARSIRAYAAITARRGSRSARRSSSVSARTSASASAGVAAGGSCAARRPRAESQSAAPATASSATTATTGQTANSGSYRVASSLLPSAALAEGRGAAARPARLGSRSIARTNSARTAIERMQRHDRPAAGRAVTAPGAVGSYRRNHVSATATNTAQSTISTRKRLKAVSTKPSEGRRTLSLPGRHRAGRGDRDDGDEDHDGERRPRASATVDPPRRGALPSMPDETSDGQRTLAAARRWSGS